MKRSYRLLSFLLIAAVVAGVCLTGAAPASAAVYVWSGAIDGSEPTFDSPYCGDVNHYDVVGPVTVSASGVYAYVDLSISYALDMQVDVYQTAFDPANPGTNYIDGADDGGGFTLTAGTNYFFVVSALCGGAGTGVWEFSLSGPVAAFTGAIDGTEPTFDSPYCGTVNSYDVVGPVTVSVSGDYTYVDLSISYALDMQVDVYAGAFDPANPAANYVDGLDDYGTLTLAAGVDYYFVISHLCGGTTTGTWEFVLAGPGTVGGGMLAAGAAGCDMYLDLNGAVVGAFVSDATVYYEPGSPTYPVITIEAGKSYWVLGLDATGQYYKIYLQCQPVWVLASTVGPNYDDVWQGRPLPTTVVE